MSHEHMVDPDPQPDPVFDRRVSDWLTAAWLVALTCALVWTYTEVRELRRMASVLHPRVMRLEELAASPDTGVVEQVWPDHPTEAGW